MLGIVLYYWDQVSNIVSWIICIYNVYSSLLTLYFVEENKEVQQYPKTVCLMPIALGCNYKILMEKVLHSSHTLNLSGSTHNSFGLQTAILESQEMQLHDSLDGDSRADMTGNSCQEQAFLQSP